ncbi:hypothetical protein [Nesterenkonia flava]|uniref:DUF3817 domain-containing protein n=1 Tax=Nesterenkonia flava TaxID=469799 RepID=A0ABU1FSW6_9MICC|nr:hypothetical protein [Nesterenkonia flava]MDR5711734.1 hypothetical protein [Nesterenkonia flava]
MSAVVVLKWLGVAEMVTLALMLVNIITVHEPLISSLLGPSHGLAYTGTVIAGILAAQGRHRVWVLSLLPGIGGWLAYRAALRSAAAVA